LKFRLSDRFWPVQGVQNLAGFVSEWVAGLIGISIVSMETHTRRYIAAHCEQVLMSHSNIAAATLKAGNVALKPHLQRYSMVNDES
jgi:hypothetical protein